MFAVEQIFRETKAKRRNSLNFKHFFFQILLRPKEQPEQDSSEKLNNFFSAMKSANNARKTNCERTWFKKFFQEPD